MKEQTGCDQTAGAAFKHVMAKIAYDESFAANGCEKTAEAEYEKAAVTAAAELEQLESETSEEEKS